MIAIGEVAHRQKINKGKNECFFLACDPKLKFESLRALQFYYVQPIAKINEDQHEKHFCQLSSNYCKHARFTCESKPSNYQ